MPMKMLSGDEQRTGTSPLPSPSAACDPNRTTPRIDSTRSSSPALAVVLDCVDGALRSTGVTDPDEPGWSVDGSALKSSAISAEPIRREEASETLHRHDGDVGEGAGRLAGGGDHVSRTRGVSGPTPRRPRAPSSGSATGPCTVAV